VGAGADALGGKQLEKRPPWGQITGSLLFVAPVLTRIVGVKQIQPCFA
jgi:hypothetical protein